MNRDILRLAIPNIISNIPVPLLGLVDLALMVSVLRVFAPVFFFLNPYWENHALWLAMVLFMFARGFVQTLLFRRSILSELQNQSISKQFKINIVTPNKQKLKY